VEILTPRNIATLNYTTIETHWLQLLHSASFMISYKHWTIWNWTVLRYSQSAE